MIIVNRPNRIKNAIIKALAELLEFCIWFQVVPNVDGKCTTTGIEDFLPPESKAVTVKIASPLNSLICTFGLRLKSPRELITNIEAFRPIIYQVPQKF